MTDQTDFIALYRELGIGPDCSLDGLRLAYRRKVADLHPDRSGGSGEDELKALNHGYAAALDFHRHYGRLPGAPPASSTHRRRDPVGPRQWMEGDVVQPEPETRRPPRMVVYGMLLLAALLVWGLSRTETPLPGFPDGVAVSKRKMTHPTAMALRLGMPAHDVVAILGDPVSRELGDTHWYYGASWVRFECAEVVDWYSSPLRPLKASRSRPSDAAASGTHIGTRRCAPVVGASSSQW